MAERSVGFGAQLGLGVALALGLFGSSVYVSKTFQKIKNSDHVIEVKGYAERKITSDTALWQGTLVVRGKDLTTAYQKLEGDRKQVLAFLEGEDLKVNLSPVMKETLYVQTPQGMNTNVVEGFVLRQTFSLTSGDVQKISALAVKVDQINGQGLEERADQFAKVSGSHAGRLMSARQGIFQVTPENSTDLSDMGTYDTSTIDKVVKIVVTLSYETN